MQRHLPDNTQYSQQTDIYDPAAIKSTVTASERPQTQALDSVANGPGFYIFQKK
jgi:hypothetical protein